MSKLRVDKLDGILGACAGTALGAPNLYRKLPMRLRRLGVLTDVVWSIADLDRSNRSKSAVYPDFAIAPLVRHNAPVGSSMPFYAEPHFVKRLP